MATLADTLRLISEDAAETRKDKAPGFCDVCATSTTTVQTEARVDGGVLRVQFIPTGAADPVATADETIKRLKAGTVT